MFKKANTKTTKLLAGILAVLLVIGAFPAGTQLVAFAATVDSYTITLTDGTDVISLDDVEVTVTDKSDSDKTKTVETVDGVATFENFVEEDSTYTVSIASVIGYEDVADFEIAPVAEGEMNANATMTAIEKIKITGVVTDENDAPYKGATVELSGYVTDTTKTNADGEYSFDAYKGKDYTVKATAKEDKYEVASATITAPSADHNSTLKFAVKYYSVTTSASAGGTITESDNSVEHGSNKTIKITANAGFRIKTLVIDGVEKTEAKGEKTYSVDFENITDSHSVSATFIEKTYKISFTISENGVVKYKEGTDEIVAGGSVEIKESTDPANPSKVVVIAEPNAGYRVAKVIVDGGTPKTFDENDKKYDTEFTMNKDHSFKVEFELNVYNVTTNDGDNGMSIVDKAKVTHGSSAVVTIMPNAGYGVSSVFVNGVDKSEDLEEIEDSLKIVISGITEDTVVEITYDKPESETPTDKFDNDDYSITFSAPEVKPGYTNDNGVYVVTLPKNSKVTLTPKSPFYGIKYNDNYAQGGYDSKKEINKTTQIDNIYLKRGPLVKQKKNIPVNVLLVIDNTAPVVTASEINPEWTNADTVTINGSVTDNLKDGKLDSANPSSGLSHIIWSKDKALSADEVLAAAENKVTIDENGKFTFESVEGEQASTYYIYAVDIAGNVSAAKRVEVKIDKVQPSVVSVVKDPSTVWTNKEVIISGEVTDTNETDENLVSGVAKVVYTTDKNAPVAGLDEANYNKDNGSYTFSVSGDQQETYYIYAIDNAGNVSEAATIDIKITNVKPIVVSVEREPGQEWHNADVIVEGSLIIEENASPINRVVYATSEMSVIEALQSENTATLENDNSAYKFTVSGEQNATYYVYAIDEAGNVSEVKTTDVKIDTTNPIVNEFIFKEKNGTAVQKFINFLSFGLFFKEEVEVTVLVEDGTEVDDSQCKEVVFRLYENSALSETYTETAPVAVEDNKAATTIPVDFKGVIKAIVYDNAGNNSGEVIATNANSNMEENETGFIMLENVASDIIFNQTTPVANSNNWYNKKDITVPVSISDETNNEINSGLYSIKAELFYNKEENASQICEFNTGLGIEENAEAAVLSKNIDLTIGTDSEDIFEYVGDGEYKIVVSVVDNCGNVSSNETVLYVDTTSAVVTEFILDNKESEGVVEETDYGYYFKAEVNVVVTLDDTVDGVKDVSDIAKVFYYTVDYSDDANPVKSENIEAAYDEETHKAIIPIKDEFKGQIYVWSIDNADNDATKAYDGSDVDPVKPDGSILEPVGKHEKEEHIVFTKAETEYATKDGTELYAKDVPVTLTVIDTYSGIREIEWEVVAPYDTVKNLKGKITVNNDKTVVEESTESEKDEKAWETTKTEKNLVTEMQKTITVRNDSNNIIVRVKMTDRAGNTTVKEIEFSIDKTKPVIKVDYADEKHDDKYGNFFNYSRKATITITERNFNSKDVDLSLSNTDGGVPSLSKWKEYKNAEDPDKTYYVATITFAEDGDYKFGIKFSDLAKNEAKEYKVREFTIDQTIPKIVSVKYDNNDALNNNYYKKERTATITIKEHNFNSKSVRVLGVATDNGKEIDFPKTSKWTSNGDTHTATIKYTADAKYTFDIKFEDKAGNSIKDYKPVEFYVDKTAPTLEITGVANQSANNGVVAPVVTVSDTNYNKDAVTISLTGINNGKVNYNGGFKDITNGQTFTYANFEKAENVDDIYTLSVTLKDKAGNETTKSISFSVNRFGSVYDLTEIKDINGKYSKVEKDIVIVETNTDTLDRDTIKVKLTKGRQTTDLKEGKDYTLAQTGGNGTWSQYKYTIKKSLFAGDGRYSISIYSVDGAGNENQNIVESKDSVVSFVIDKTAPLITPIDFESGTKNQPTEYDTEMKKVSIEIKDNLSLNDVVIYLNDKKVDYEVDGDSYIIDVPESDEQQTVKVVAKDKAGNEHTVLVEHVLVSTNMVVRWYNNKPVFFGSIAGVLGVAGIIIFFVVKKKKKDDKEEK